jgi:hypothetical protein
MRIGIDGMLMSLENKSITKTFLKSFLSFSHRIKSERTDNKMLCVRILLKKKSLRNKNQTKDKKSGLKRRREKVYIKVNKNLKRRQRTSTDNEVCVIFE